MEFRLLGPIEAIRDGRSLPLGGAKPRALLALLLLHANEVVSRDRLIEALWPGRRAGLRRAQPRRPGLAAPEGVRAGRAPAHAKRRLRPRGRARRDRRSSVRALLDEGRRANAAGEPAEPCSRSSLLSRSGAGRLWPRSPTRTSRTPTRSGSRSSGSSRPRSGSTLSWRSAGTTLLIAELEALTGASPPARAAPRAAHARALPRRAAGGGAARVLGHAQAARGGARDRAGPGAPRARAGDPAPGSGARTPARPRVPSRRRGLLVGAGALVLAAAAVALVVGLTQGSTEGAHALAAPTPTSSSMQAAASSCGPRPSATRCGSRTAKAPSGASRRRVS